MIVEFNIPGDLAGLRQTLCRAQAYVMHEMPLDEFKPHAQRLEALIKEIDRHRPLGRDGLHGNLHTDTCGCPNKGHGPWCDHTDCCGCIYALSFERICPICRHDWSIPENRVAKCW